MIYSLLVGFWPVWIWFLGRILDKSDEPLGIVALITLVVMLSFHSERIKGRGPTIGVCVAVLVYCISVFIAPKLVSAAIALVSIGLFLRGRPTVRNTTAQAESLRLGDWCLLLLSLPVVATLNFYLGYPLRLIVAAVAAPLLNITGFGVKAIGTTLVWQTATIEIDAPCSGVRMLWAALYLAATLASLRNLNILRSSYLIGLALGAALFANILRVTSLFYVEAGVVRVPAQFDYALHEGIGVAVFLMLAIGLLLAASALGKAEAQPIDVSAAPAITIAPTVPLSQRTAFLGVCALALICSSITGSGEIFTMRPPRRTSENGPIPDTFEGKPVRQRAMRASEEAFARDFPGTISVFKTGDETVVMRHITKATRQLHPAADCYRASGYEIRYLPLYTDGGGHRWGVIEARKDFERIKIRERIYDADGHNWTDVSSWYWSAAFDKKDGSWTSVTVAAWQ